jgi:hypothetical protein
MLECEIVLHSSQTWIFSWQQIFERFSNAYGSFQFHYWSADILRIFMLPGFLCSRRYGKKHIYVLFSYVTALCDALGNCKKVLQSSVNFTIFFVLVWILKPICNSIFHRMKSINIKASRAWGRPCRDWSDEYWTSRWKFFRGIYPFFHSYNLYFCYFYKLRFRDCLSH